MRYLKLILTIIILGTNCIFANQRTIEEIESIARSLFAYSNSINKRTSSINHINCIPSSEIMKDVAFREGEEAFYLCRAQGLGCLVIPVDDRMGDLLAVLDSDSFIADNMPEAMIEIMKIYVNDYLSLKKVELKTTPHGNRSSASIASTTTIGPLLSTTWGQNEPYNNNCPIRNGKRCVTGCVATAMAQIMNYHKCPEEQFDWNNMDNSYLNYTAEQASAVAELMRSCGLAVGMSYGTNTSTAYVENVFTKLPNTYGYSKAISWMERSESSANDWHNMLKQEINEGRPVYYSGDPSSGIGHAFIVDGYRDYNDGSYPYFHINWGWDGDNNGYFLMSSLLGYNYNQVAIVNIKPEDGKIDSDAGYYQADSIVVTSPIMVKGQSKKINVCLINAENHRYADFNGYINAFIVNISTGEKQRISTWSRSDMGYSTGIMNTSNLVCRNYSFKPTLPAGNYKLEFYSSSSAYGADRRVTVKRGSASVKIVESEVPISYVNLGLTSGTLWANKNIGAATPEDYGSYYAWGETNTKTEYTLSNYQYYNNSKWTKYCLSSSEGTLDNKTTLDASDDAAYVNWGSEWLTPNYKQYQELVSECTWEYMYLNGVDVYKVTGPNGNYIYIPLSGYIKERPSLTSYCYEGWTSSLYDTSMARIMQISFWTNPATNRIGSRECGRTVRPVYAQAFVKITSLKLSATQLELPPGKSTTLTASILPTNATEQTVVWESSNPQVASVSNGVITALNTGVSYIKAKTTDGTNIEASCKVLVSGSRIITFADQVVRTICIQNWDANGDGELDVLEAASVTDIGTIFSGKSISVFDEFSDFSGVKIIPKYAFSNCRSLYKISIPNSVEKIDEGAFTYTRIWDVNIPASVKEIVGKPFDGEWDDCPDGDDYCWARYPGNYVVAADNNFFSSVDGVLYNKDKTILIDIPLGKTGIVNIPSSVQASKDNYYPTINKINVSAKTWYEMDFSDWQNYSYYDSGYDEMRSLVYDGNNVLFDIETDIVNIPSGVDKIGSKVFGHTGLMKVILPSTLSTIGNSSFEGCNYLSSISIPQGVKSIGNKAFMGCSNIESIEIPGSISHIGKAALSTYNLKSIKVNSDNVIYDSRENSNAVIETNTNTLIAGCCNTVIPSTIATIGDSAFYYCNGLKSITIPASVKSIGAGAFYYSYALKTVVNRVPIPLPINNYTFSARNGITLYVPSGSKAAYEAAEYWKDFKEIREIGDANGDETITITDAVAIVNNILGNQSGQFDNIAADVNQDGELTITDAVEVVNIILNSGSSAPLIERPNAEALEVGELE